MESNLVLNNNHGLRKFEKHGPKGEGLLEYFKRVFYYLFISFGLLNTQAHCSSQLMMI
jgi:hypothetical protein